MYTLKTLAVAAAIASLAAMSGGSVRSSTSIVGVAYFRESTTVLSHNGAFPGSTQAWRTKVILLHSPKVVGTGGIACIYTTNLIRECYGTYVLPQGRIKVLGEINNRHDFTLAVIGGTGVYSAVTGVAKFSPGLVTFYFD